MEPTKKPNEVATGDEPSEIQRLKEELRREHEMYLRALADFDNYRRRVERERSSAALTGKRDLILSLLEVLDGFDRAIQARDGGSSSVAEGLQAIHRNLLRLLETQGVT